MKFQQKQQVVKEQKKIDMLGSSTRIGKTSSAKDTDETKILTSTIGAGKVRQMFEERRTGVDKSYPLKPISGNSTKNSMNGRDQQDGHNNGMKIPPKSKSMNGIILRQKPNNNMDNEYHHGTFDRDQLNNAVSASKYNSTNRVPSLKSTTSNNNINNSHNNTAVAKQLKPVSTSTANNNNRGVNSPVAATNVDKKPIETRKVCFAL